MTRFVASLKTSVHSASTLFVLFLLLGVEWLHALGAPEDDDAWE